jgi:hypothetical protein
MGRRHYRALPLAVAAPVLLIPQARSFGEMVDARFVPGNEASL